MRIGDKRRLAWWRFDDFSAAQIYELLRFRQQIFVVEQASPYPDLDGFDQRSLHLLLRVDGNLSGCLRLRLDRRAAEASIGRVAVASQLRRQGLARRMMLEALARCARDYPECVVRLNAQEYLVPFYDSLGFRPISEPTEEYGVPHVEMLLRHNPTPRVFI